MYPIADTIFFLFWVESDIKYTALHNFLLFVYFIIDLSVLSLASIKLIEIVQKPTTQQFSNTLGKTINWSLIKVLVNKLELIWKQCLRIWTKQIVMNCQNSCPQRSKAIYHYIWGPEIRNLWSLRLMSTKLMPRLPLWFEFIFYFVFN